MKTENSLSKSPPLMDHVSRILSSLREEAQEVEPESELGTAQPQRVVIHCYTANRSFELASRPDTITIHYELLTIIAIAKVFSCLLVCLITQN